MNPRSDVECISFAFISRPLWIIHSSGSLFRFQLNYLTRRTIFSSKNRAKNWNRKVQKRFLRTRFSPFYPRSNWEAFSDFRKFRGISNFEKKKIDTGRILSFNDLGNRSRRGIRKRKSSGKGRETKALVELPRLLRTREKVVANLHAVCLANAFLVHPRNFRILLPEVNACTVYRCPAIKRKKFPVRTVFLYRRWTTSV